MILRWPKKGRTRRTPTLNLKEGVLGGLELGVAGLVHALASVGCFPAASCRGHSGPEAWARHPVVYLAVDRPRASVLEQFVQVAGYGFGVDLERSDLLIIEGPVHRRHNVHRQSGPGQA
jgi:hypothetical protein